MGQSRYMDAGSDGNDFVFKVVQNTMPLGYVKMIQARGWVTSKGDHQICYGGIKV